MSSLLARRLFVVEDNKKGWQAHHLPATKSLHLSGGITNGQ